MHEVCKELVDEAIRISKKYYKTGDTDLLPKYHEVMKKAFEDGHIFCDELLAGVTLKRRDYAEPNETYYGVLSLVGFKVEGVDFKQLKCENTKKVKVARTALDEIIRLEKEYFRNNKKNYAAIHGAYCDAFGDKPCWLSNIIVGILLKRKKCDEPRKTYYKVFEFLGFEIIEE